MQFGVCGDVGTTQAAARAAYDFSEWSVPALLKPGESEELFRAGLEALRSAGLPYRVANCFVPGELKITGPAVDHAALRAYVAVVMQRAERAGVNVIVFGSGGARRIPEGFDPRTAHDQLVAFCRMIAPGAHDHGVVVVVEPLNKADCNVLTTVSECAGLVNEVAHPAIRLLVDAYHHMRDGDSFEDIVRHGALLSHVHVATLPGRLPPGVEPCDLTRFFRALADAKYDGRVSIEAQIRNPPAELPLALATLRRYAAAAAGEHAGRVSQPRAGHGG